MQDSGIRFHCLALPACDPKEYNIVSIPTRYRMIVWTILVAAVVLNIVGYVWNLYERISWFDRLVHGYTFFALTLSLALWLYGVVLTGVRTHGVLFVLIVACLGVGLGALWEIAEWGLDQVVSGNIIRGKFDTILDLIMDTLGSLLAGWVALAMLRVSATKQRDAPNYIRND